MDPTPRTPTESSPNAAPAVSGTALKATPGIGLVDVIRRARETVAELTGLKVDAVSACNQQETGWTATVDVVESHARLGDNDMLATYEITLAPDGEITGFSRIRRYNRSDAAGREG